MTMMQKKFRVTFDGTIPPKLQAIYDQVEKDGSIYHHTGSDCSVYQMENGQVALCYTAERNDYHEMHIFMFDTIEQFMFHIKQQGEFKEHEIIDKIKGVVRDEFLVSYILTRDI